MGRRTPARVHRRPAVPLGIAGLVVLGVSRLFGAGGASPHIVGPPPGHTGGFGEPTCIVCHTGSEFNTPGSTLEVVGLGAVYRRDRSYAVTVRMRSFDMGAAGFQATFRWAEGMRRGMTAGSARAVDRRVAVVEDSSGISYVQHTSIGTHTTGEITEWTFQWTAPTEPGAIALHLAANSADGDNSPLGDLVYTWSAILRPETER